MRGAREGEFEAFLRGRRRRVSGRGTAALHRLRLVAGRGGGDVDGGCRLALGGGVLGLEFADEAEDFRDFPGPALQRFLGAEDGAHLMEVEGVQERVVGQ